MTNILVDKAVIEQALEALETLNSSDSYKTHNAAAALREALEHSGKANEFKPDWDGTLGLVEEIKRLAIENERLRHGEIKYEDWEFNPMTGESLLVENHGQEPVGWYKPSDFVLYRTKPDDVFVYVPLYAAPVHTVDLTDDEIRFWIGRFPFLLNEESEKWVIGLARAVIAADREKNK